MGFGSSINFSILPGGQSDLGIFATAAIKPEPPSSESESEDVITDDAMGVRF